jgi:uncharacterized membrane protein YfhO
VQQAGEVLAVEVPEGVTEVRIAYRPPGFRVGLAVSALSICVAAGWLVWRRKRDRS